MPNPPHAHSTIDRTDASEFFEFGPLAEAANYRRLLFAEFAPYLRGDVLEVGAGIGHCTEDMMRVPAVRSITALEPDARFAGEFRKRAPGVTLINGTTEDMPGGSAFDATVCVNVLEHIRDDADELARQRTLLGARRGHLLLLVPARPEIYAPIDRDFGHWRRYTRPKLRGLLEAAGFEVVRLRYYNWAGYFAWWWSFRVLGRRRFEVAQVKLFDRWIFPWVHAWETRVFAPPFGQSLLAVARARGEPR